MLIVRRLLSSKWVLPALCCGLAASNLRAAPDISVTINAPRATSDLFDGSKRPAPYLPSGAEARRMGGKVVLRVKTASVGVVEQAATARSSGSAYLDESARLWVLHVWRYPGSAGGGTHEETISFQTTEEDVRTAAQEIVSARRTSPDTPRPPYPYLARRLGWSGDVTVRLVSDGKGGVGKAEIAGSSGHRLLDLLAQTYAEGYWRLPGNASKTALVFFRTSLARDVRPVRTRSGMDMRWR